MEKYIVESTSEGRKELSELVSKAKAAARKITRARILLQSDASACGPSWTDKQISEAFGVHTNTVHGVRRRSVEHGLAAVMDNLNTHSIGSLYEAFAPAQARALARRLEIHYTPKHGSWLSVAKIESGVLSRQCLGRRIESI